MHNLQHIRRLSTLRTRLRDALHTTESLPALREHLVNVLADLGSGLRTFDPAPEECAADTLRAVYPPDFEPESAPGVPLTRPSGGA